MRFTVHGAKSGMIMQYVKHRTTRDGVTCTVDYTEAWPVKRGAPVPRDDLFLVPFGFHPSSGSIEVDAVLYFLPGTMEQIRRVAGLLYGSVPEAGSLRSRPGPPPLAVRPVGTCFHRRWRATWSASCSAKSFAPTYTNSTRAVPGDTIGLFDPPPPSPADAPASRPHAPPCAGALLPSAPASSASHVPGAATAAVLKAAFAQDILVTLDVPCATPCATTTPMATDASPTVPTLGPDPLPPPDDNVAQSSAPRRATAALTGQLQFVSSVLSPGSTYLREFYNAIHVLSLHESLRPNHDYTCSVPLPNGFWVDFDFYKSILAKHTGTRLLRGDWVSITRLWTDASSAGTGYTYLGNDEAGQPLTELQIMAGVWPRHLQLQTSNWRELRTILAALERAHDQQEATGNRVLDGTVVYGFTDNAVSASVVNRGTSSSPALMRLVRGIRAYESLLGCHVIAVWVPGTEIIRQGTDGLSRQSHDEGALAPNAAAPIEFSPIDRAAPAPEEALLDAVAAAFPSPPARLADPASWVEAEHPSQPVILTPPPSLARQAIDQVLRWAAARPYETAAAVILPNDYASSWSRLTRYFHRVYFARAGHGGRPADAEGTMAVLLILPHLDTSHDQVTFASAPPSGQPFPSLQRYARHLSGEERVCPGDPLHPSTPILRQMGVPPPPQLPLHLLQRTQMSTLHRRGLAADHTYCGPQSSTVFSPAVAPLLEAVAYRYALRRDAAAAKAVVRAEVPRRQRAPWLRAVYAVTAAVAVRSALAPAPEDPRATCIFWRLPFRMWSDYAFGVVPDLAAVPKPFHHDNYFTASHPAVYKEIARLRKRKYVSGPFHPGDTDNVHVVIPLGAVAKKDTTDPRVILDATACGLNDCCNFLKFKYPSFQDMVLLAYPGAFYSKLDWTDAFFSVPLYEPFRRFFAFKHPESGELFHYDVCCFGFRLSPLYYARLVQHYVDALRLTPRFNGNLVVNHAHTPAHHRALPPLYRRRVSGVMATAIEQYCDDGMLFSPSEHEGLAALRQASALVSHLGAIPKVSKTVPPTQHGDHILGLSLDTRDEQLKVGIPPERLERLRTDMAAFEAAYRPLSTGGGGSSAAGHRGQQ